MRLVGSGPGRTGSLGGVCGNRLESRGRGIAGGSGRLIGKTGRGDIGNGRGRGNPLVEVVQLLSVGWARSAAASGLVVARLAGLGATRVVGHLVLGGAAGHGVLAVAAVYTGRGVGAVLATGLLALGDGEGVAEIHFDWEVAGLGLDAADVFETV